MPKYYEFKVCGYYLYYTASCVIEAMHVHASDRKSTEAGSVKFLLKVTVIPQWKNRELLQNVKYEK